MAKKSRESDQSVKNLIGDPKTAPGIGSRISAAAKLFESRRYAVDYCGISSDTLRRWEREEVTPSFDAIARLAYGTGTSLDWLSTGQGPMRPAVELEWGDAPAAIDWGHERPARPVRDELDTKLDSVENQLRNLEVPFDHTALQDTSIIDIKQTLKDISQNPDAADTQRARADMMLNLAFDDEGAQRKSAQRQKDVGAKLRASRRAYEEAIDAIGYEPPPAVAEALKTVLFAHGLDAEGAVILLTSFKEHCLDPQIEGHSPYAW